MELLLSYIKVKGNQVDQTEMRSCIKLPASTTSCIMNQKDQIILSTLVDLSVSLHPGNCSFLLIKPVTNLKTEAPTQNTKPGLQLLRACPSQVKVFKDIPNPLIRGDAAGKFHVYLFFLEEIPMM